MASFQLHCLEISLLKTLELWVKRRQNGTDQCTESDTFQLSAILLLQTLKFFSLKTTTGEWVKSLQRRDTYKLLSILKDLWEEKFKWSFETTISELNTLLTEQPLSLSLKLLIQFSWLRTMFTRISIWRIKGMLELGEEEKLFWETTLIETWLLFLDWGFIFSMFEIWLSMDFLRLAFQFLHRILKMQWSSLIQLLLIRPWISKMCHFSIWVLESIEVW